LNWSATSGYSYNIYRATSSGGESNRPYSSSSSVPWSDTGWNNTTSYYYKITAVSNGVEGALSNEVSVKPVVTSMVISPSPGAVLIGGTQQFVAVAKNQYGNSMVAQPTTWQATGDGTISSTGLFTAGGSIGQATVTATSNGVAGTATVSVSFAATHLSLVAPSTAQAGVAVSVAVTALDANNNISTAYSGTIAFASTDPLATLPSNSTFIGGTGTFSIIFGKAGNQTVSAADIANSAVSGTSNSVGVSPNGVVSAIAVYPEQSAVAPGSSEQFTTKAVDKYGNVITAAPTYTWSVTSGTGTINSSTGLFSAPVSAETDIIQAITGTVSATATVTTAPPVASNLVATAGDGFVSLTWTPDQNGNSYTLYRSRISGNESSTELMSNITSIPYIDANVINGSTYYYQVQAVNTRTGPGVLSNEAFATPNPITPPTTIMTSAQAIAAARAFCVAIGRSVATTDIGTAQYPLPQGRQATAAAFTSPCWFVTFEGGALKIAICDATGVIAWYHDATSVKSIVQNPPVGTYISTSSATQAFQTVLSASHQTDNMALPSVQFKSIHPGSTTGDLCKVRALRMALGYPFHDQFASAIFQAETGTLLDFSLVNTTPIPASATNNVNQATAISVANQALSTAGVTGTTLASAIEMWIEPNMGWPASETTIPAAPRLAWVVAYSSSSAVIEVWIDASSGAVIGGIDAVIGRAAPARKKQK
jgi:fibronectin type 3 domain-containing protein